MAFLAHAIHEQRCIPHQIHLPPSQVRRISHDGLDRRLDVSYAPIYLNHERLVIDFVLRRDAPRPLGKWKRVPNCIGGVFSVPAYISSITGRKRQNHWYAALRRGGGAEVRKESCRVRVI